MPTATETTMRQLWNKVPEVTIFFWIIKILATTVGETAADFLNFNLHFGLTGTSAVMALLLAVFMVLQVRAKAYIPWLYWITVVLISIVGTLVTDNLVDNLGVSLGTTTAVFSVALLTTFIVWYAFEKTLSIHSIFTVRRELFYWAAILFTFALGTAAGDLTAEGLKLGYAHSALLFGALIVAVTAVFYLLKGNAITCFWAAYILTRPLGASCGDLLAQSPPDGGLGLGTVATSGLFLAAIAGLVIYLSATRRDLEPVTTAQGENVLTQ
ncbi:hypothetical protein FY034_15130 [Trichlorobacter lovleyi]|uniref:COG4705 family protein n=1 Tax=Trichlorobacter lovleyi TaxID=313985 RepID=UPI00223F6ACE|nr:hypothetical protein [Trichlorobacter lovleyi]QOX80210.1 hypothetical protein FY034_15130 [Trichlorobacter lovleyi]